MTLLEPGLDPSQRRQSDARRLSSGPAPADLVLAALGPILVIAVIGGPWLQLVPFGGDLGLFGATWLVVLGGAVYFFAFGGTLPGPSARVAGLLAGLTAILTLGGSFASGFGGQTIPVLVSIVGIPLMIGFGSAVRLHSASSRRLLVALEAALVLQAALIVPKVLLLGTNANYLSSRPFGLAAAVALGWRLHRHPSPLAAALDPIVWSLIGCALLSQSRTAILGIALSLVASSLVQNGFRPRHVVRTVLVILAIVGATTSVLLVSDTARDRVFAQDVVENERSISLSNRENIWPETVKEILRDPITPNGAGASARFVAEISDGEHANPHNDYLRVAFDGGVLSVVGLVGALCWMVVRSRRIVAENPKAVAAVNLALVLGVAMAFTNVLTFLSVSWPAFLLMGAASEAPSEPT